MIFLVRSNVKREGLYNLCKNAISPGLPHVFYFHVLNPIIDTNYLDCVKIYNTNETLIGGDISILNEYFDKATIALNLMPVTEQVSKILVDRIKTSVDELEKYFAEQNNVFISVTPETEKMVADLFKETKTLIVTDNRYLNTPNIVAEADIIVDNIDTFRYA